MLVGALSTFVLAGQVAALAAGSSTPVSPPAAADTVTAWTADVEVGRYWHAARAVRGFTGAGPLTWTDRLALAEAEAGWGNWSDVITTLGDGQDLPAEGSARGLFLLARAYEEIGDSARAAERYQAFEKEAPLGSPDLHVARVRRARLLAGLDRTDEAIDALKALRPNPHGLSSWVALELARAAANEGREARTMAFLDQVTDPTAAAAKWELLPDLHLSRGDTAAALSALAGSLTVLDSPATRARAWNARGGLLLARGDSAEAGDAYLNALEAGAPPSLRAEAAAGLSALGLDEPDLALSVARSLARDGRAEEAVDAYARHAELLDPGVPNPEVVLEYASLLIRTKRHTLARPLLEELAGLREEHLGAPALDLLADVQRARRQTGQAEATDAQLVRRFPNSDEAANVVFFQADAAHDRGDLGEAAARYQQVTGMAPESRRAGLAWMRLGQIRITQKNYRDAGRVFAAYLDAQPAGSHASEATYWSAWAAIQSGEVEQAAALLTRVRDSDPLSYYAVQTARLLDEPFTIPVASSDVPIVPPWLRSGFRHLRLLKQADLHQSESVFRAQLEDRARVNDDLLLLLARELTHQGHNPWEGIRLGWEVRRRGYPWNRLLLEVIYPFPYREMVEREAEEWGVSPHLVAGLIRQESAFFAEARSSANARGLMQVLPVTGGQLAREIGPERFRPSILYQPDVNLHLGTAYLRDMLTRYENDLPLVLSAYNAGPTRATRWRRFPEAGDPVRFTERIPFRETRGYVKNVTRNMEIYRFLYGGDG